MRLFLYYAGHTLKNQIRKLFRTWVMIFIVVCFAIGLIAGLAASLFDASEEIPDSPPAETVTEPEPELYPVIRDSNGDVVYTFNMPDMVDMIVTAIVIFIIILTLATYEKQSIFLPADATLLFTSPMTPQNVLFFRLAASLGLVLLGGVYFLFQIPNLVYNMGLAVPVVISMAVALAASSAVSIVVKVIAYLYSTGGPGKRRIVNYVMYGAILSYIAGAFIYRIVTSTESLIVAGIKYVTSVNSRFIPFIGWIKGMVMYTMEEKYGAAALCLTATVGGLVLAVFLISRMKADYYEEAMAKSEEVARLQEAVKSKGLTFGSTRKTGKDRSETVKRDGLNHGSGANIYFFKEMYNRFRFAHLKIFTKTAIFYSIIGIGLCLILRLFADIKTVVPLMLVLSAMVFYRSIGNPLEKDIGLHYFSLIPDGTLKKVFWSLAAGIADAALDMAVPVIAGSLIMGIDPSAPAAGIADVGSNLLICLGLMLLALSLDFFSSCVGAFINLSVPVNAGATIKQVVQIMFIYFGLLPDILVLGIVGTILGIVPAAIAATVINLILGTVFMMLLPLFV